MGLVEDIKYVSYIGAKLEGFRKKGDNLWNFRCPFCGDSEKNTNKKRGYIFRKDANFVFFCHNCGISKKFDKFLYELDTDLYNEYRKESSFKIFKKDENEKLFQKKRSLPFLETKNFLKNVTELVDDHPCLGYIESRLIPRDKWKKLYWTDNFKSIIKNMFGDKYDVNSFPDSGLVFTIVGMDLPKYPCIGYQIRSIDTNIPKARRFITCIDSDHISVFGHENKEPEFIVEGPIDSLFLDNCIATISSSLWRAKLSNAIYINDCEPRNPQICKQIKKCIDLGYKVTLLPEPYYDLDINDIIKKFGYSKQELTELIKTYTFSGLTARMKFSAWKQV